MIWGLAIGWVYPTEKAPYVTIIPRGQEAELMGTYISVRVTFFRGCHRWSFQL
jgi:hypothetical protein